MFKNFTFYETWWYIFVFKKDDCWIFSYITLIQAELYDSANKLPTSFCKILNNKTDMACSRQNFLTSRELNIQGTTEKDGVFQFLNVLKGNYKANKLNLKNAEHFNL